MAAATRSANMSWIPRNRGSSERLSEIPREDSCGTARGPVVPPCVLSVETDCPEAMSPKKATRHVVRSRTWEFLCLQQLSKAVYNRCFAKLKERPHGTVVLLVGIQRLRFLGYTTRLYQ